MDGETECPICMESYNRSEGAPFHSACGAVSPRDDSLRRLKDGLVNTSLQNPDNCKHFICEFCCDKLTDLPKSQQKCPICRADWREFVDLHIEENEYCEYCECYRCDCDSDNEDCYQERCIEHHIREHTGYCDCLYHHDISGETAISDD